MPLDWVFLCDFSGEGMHSRTFRGSSRNRELVRTMECQAIEQEKTKTKIGTRLGGEKKREDLATRWLQGANKGLAGAWKLCRKGARSFRQCAGKARKSQQRHVYRGKRPTAVKKNGKTWEHAVNGEKQRGTLGTRWNGRLDSSGPDLNEQEEILRLK